jgi:hypothetical protein
MSQRHLAAAMSVTMALLAGCSSMSKSECERADWQRRGSEDGRAGYPSNYIAEHREACGKVGIQPDEARWRVGWSQGIVSYCTPDSAWNSGVNNRTYYGVCADLNEATFLRYHRAGQLVYRARQELNQTQTRMSKLEEDLKKATKDDDRRRLRDDLGRAERERNRLTALIVTLELAGPPR